MVPNHAPRNRGCNVGVSFDLAEFTQRFFAALGAGASFEGPGPCSLSWLSSTTSRDERFAIGYLAEELFSKYDDGKPSKEKRRKAVQRFIEGETLCALTNCKFNPLPSGQLPAWLEGLTESDGMATECAVFQRAQKLIGRVLGPFPGWESVLQYADFGPGATTRLPRRKGHRSNKWAGNPHATPFLTSSLQTVFGQLPLLSERLPEPGRQMSAGNKLDWVPKNYKTDRTIAIEPDWNMFVQKGIGGLIRRKLKRVKQDLDDQSTNRFLAAVGSITGELATLDMSMASDTVSYRLVEYLLSPDWFEALEQCRSSVGFYVDEGVENAVIYEKFSSMGNGYTFELESLIFWGLLRAVLELTGETDRRLYIYGDDIVVPSGIAGEAMLYLERAGFVVNPDKSYWDGPFRESCGGHYFDGIDVTPFYVREPVDSLDRLFLLHNNVYRWLNRFPGICNPENVREVLSWIRSHAPQEWQRPRILSEEVGDGAFIGSFDEVCPSPIGKTRRYRGWEGWRSETLQFRPRRHRGNPGKGPVLRCTCDSTAGQCGIRDHYPRGSGPDLASLWPLERESMLAESRSNRVGSAAAAFSRPDEKGRVVTGDLQYHAEWAALSRDSAFARVSAAKQADVPWAERFWYVGVQVLPWTPGDSWW